MLSRFSLLLQRHLVGRKQSQLNLRPLTRSRLFPADERFNDLGDRFYFLSGSVVGSDSRPARKGRGLSLFAFE